MPVAPFLTDTPSNSCKNASAAGVDTHRIDSDVPPGDAPGHYLYDALEGRCGDDAKVISVQIVQVDKALANAEEIERRWQAALDIASASSGVGGKASIDNVGGRLVDPKYARMREVKEDLAAMRARLVDALIRTLLEDVLENDDFPDLLLYLLRVKLAEGPADKTESGFLDGHATIVGGKVGAYCKFSGQGMEM